MKKTYAIEVGCTNCANLMEDAQGWQDAVLYAGRRTCAYGT